MTDIKEKIQQISIEKRNGRDVITYQKSQIVGMATSADVINHAYIVATMQLKMYMEKLAKGTMLNDKEVMALAKLTEMAHKIPQSEPDVENLTKPSAIDVEILKSQVFAKLKETFEEKK